jgi:hypothetical protein
MAIVKIKKDNASFDKLSKLQKKTSKKESTFARVSREMDEAAAKKIQDAKQKKLADIAEEKRLEKLVIPYLDNLQDQIVEKDLLSFWTWVDEPGFKKIKNMTFKDMKKFINKDIDKYKNRKIVDISILFHHHDKPTTSIRQAGYYLTVSISIFPVDKNGVLNGDDNAWGADLAWTLQDFKTTKFSFKLIETILRPVGKRKMIFPSLLGFPITDVIEDLKKIRVNFDKVLTPLAGA